jgi:hypothetical protein
MCCGGYLNEKPTATYSCVLLSPVSCRVENLPWKKVPSLVRRTVAGAERSWILNVNALLGLRGRELRGRGEGGGAERQAVGAISHNCSTSNAMKRQDFMRGTAAMQNEYKAYYTISNTNPYVPYYSSFTNTLQIRTIATFAQA